MLVNRTYLGYVKYQQYAKHPDGSRSMENPVEWFAGQHEPIINQDLFEQCQEIRESRRSRSTYNPKYWNYLLRGILYCAECVDNMPDDVDPETYGRMRSQATRSGYLYYRCRAHDYGSDSHAAASAEIIEQQVVDVLMNLQLPDDACQDIIESLARRIGDQRIDDRIKEIKEVIERMDFRWDQGFITEREVYIEQRLQLQQELEQLTPIPNDALEQATDMLDNFADHWKMIVGSRDEQEHLIKLIFERVGVMDNKIMSITMKPDYQILLT